MGFPKNIENPRKIVPCRSVPRIPCQTVPDLIIFRAGYFRAGSNIPCRAGSGHHCYSFLVDSAHGSRTCSTCYPFTHACKQGALISPLESSTYFEQPKHDLYRIPNNEPQHNPMGSALCRRPPGLWIWGGRGRFFFGPISTNPR